MTTELTPRQWWTDAVWDSALRPLPKLVALAYARHVDDDLTRVWVAGARLRRLTGLSRDAANRALRTLEDDGWFVVSEPARQHYATRYALTVPPTVPPPGTLSGTPGGTVQAPAFRETDSRATLSVPSPDASVPSPDASVPSPDASVPPGGNEPLTNPYPTTPGGAGGLAVPDSARAALRAAGLDEDDVTLAWTLAARDPDTRNPAARCTTPGGAAHFAGLVRDHHRVRAETRHRSRPPCPDHPGQRAGVCSGCAADHLDPAAGHAGNPQPSCPRCTGVAP